AHAIHHLPAATASFSPAPPPPSPRHRAFLGRHSSSVAKFKMPVFIFYFSISPAVMQRAPNFLAKLRCGDLESIDPVCRAAGSHHPLPKRRFAADNPHETWHSVDEVLSWFHENDVTYLKLPTGNHRRTQQPPRRNVR